jgi:hypothetical protein
MKLSLLRVTVPLLVVLATACQTTQAEPLPGESVEHDLAQDPDAALISRHPQILRRRGAVLSVRSGGGERSFRDRGVCAGFDTCERHRVVAVLRDRYVAVQVAHGEGFDTLLLDTQSGNGREIGAAPHPSPSGDLFFVGYSEEVGDWTPLMGASVWRLSDAGAVAERLRVVDTTLAYVTSFVAWRSERCVEFRGTRGFPFDGNSQERSFFLSEQGGDWRLFEERPPDCAGAAG